MTGNAKPSSYTGDSLGPSGIDGINRFQPQAVGYGPGQKEGGAYGGIGGLPFGGQNHKFGIGGLQFGGSPSSTAANGAGTYGNGVGSSYGPVTGGKSGKYGSGNRQQHLGLGSTTNTPGKYGYGRMPYEIQTAGQNPKAKSTSKHGSAYQPKPAAMGQNGQATEQYGNLGGSQVPYAAQAIGAGAAKSAGKHMGQSGYKSQPLETSAVRSEFAVPYDSLPLESDTGAKSYFKGESPTPAAAVEAASMDRRENVGYISGQVQPEVVAFPAAPTPQPSVPYPSAAPYLPVDAAVTAYGAAKGPVDSAPVTESQVASQGLEQTDELQQMPQQIHIQQHLKLHFHPQGGNDDKHDLNGFFGNANGNGGYKG
ncbi:calymmin [Eucyclogobius newberryi]|uniref:calymmin n=1 Tax=Eucyclogobius newberryi TaxID=166745 RepID=UPI003B5917DD